MRDDHERRIARGLFAFAAILFLVLMLWLAFGLVWVSPTGSIHWSHI